MNTDNLKIIRNMVLTMLLWCEEEKDMKLESAKGHLENILILINEDINSK